MTKYVQRIGNSSYHRKCSESDDWEVMGRKYVKDGDTYKFIIGTVGVIENNADRDCPMDAEHIAEVLATVENNDWSKFVEICTKFFPTVDWKINGKHELFVNTLKQHGRKMRVGLDLNSKMIITPKQAIDLQKELSDLVQRIEKLEQQNRCILSKELIKKLELRVDLLYKHLA